MNENNIKWPLIGNSHVFKFLSKTITSQKLAQTYIFSGLSNVGKTKVATHFAKILLCKNNQENPPCNECVSCKKVTQSQISHPDLHILKKEPDKKNTSIDQVRSFIRELKISSYANNYKIGIIKNADNLNINGFNALLKTLEEPNEKVIIILTTKNLSLIPKTIISRAQTLRFKPVNQDLIYDLLINNYNAERADALNYSRMCLGKPAIAIKLLENKEYFNKYYSNITAFIEFNKTNISERFQKIEQIIPAKTPTSEAVQITTKLINAWLALTRDCLLLKLSQVNYVQHTILKNELTLIEKQLSQTLLLNTTATLQKAKKYLTSNVSPKNVLEYIAINL